MDRDAQVIERFESAMREGPSLRAHARHVMNPAEGSGRIEIVSGATIEPESINWLWKDWLAVGKFQILAGVPGTGKTTIGLALAATITTAGRWPDGSRYQDPGNVLVWSGEDSPRDTLLPRLLAMGADRSRVYFVGSYSADGKQRPFDPSRDLEVLTREAKEIGDIRLLMLDPIVNVVAGDSNKNAETRRSLQPVVDLATGLNAAALGISHYTKGTNGRDPLERVTGSGAFGALARAVFGVVKILEEDGTVTRRFVRVKSNNSPEGDGFTYDLEQSEVPGYPILAQRVLWGSPLTGEARELLTAPETNDNNGERSATAEAMEWLRVELRDGARKVSEIQREARQAGIGDKPLRSAREKLGIKPTRREFVGGWWWVFPDAQDAQFAQDAQQKRVGILGVGGHLGEQSAEKMVDLDVEI
jgi:putative DNA primase/helicase